METIIQNKQQFKTILTKWLLPLMNTNFANAENKIWVHLFYPHLTSLLKAMVC